MPIIQAKLTGHCRASMCSIKRDRMRLLQGKSTAVGDIVFQKGNGFPTNLSNESAVVSADIPIGIVATACRRQISCVKTNKVVWQHRTDGHVIQSCLSQTAVGDARRERNLSPGSIRIWGVVKTSVGRSLTAELCRLIRVNKTRESQFVLDLSTQELIIFT